MPNTTNARERFDDDGDYIGLDLPAGDPVRIVTDVVKHFGRDGEEQQDNVYRYEYANGKWFETTFCPKQELLRLIVTDRSAWDRGISARDAAGARADATLAKVAEPLVELA